MYLKRKELFLVRSATTPNKVGPLTIFTKNPAQPYIQLERDVSKDLIS